VVIRVHGSTGPHAHKTPVVGFTINGRDQMGEGVFSASNRGRWWWIGRLRTHPPLWERQLRTEHGGTGVISPELGWGSALMG
jgi:hypothetical protein